MWYVIVAWEGLRFNVPAPKNHPVQLFCFLQCSCLSECFLAHDFLPWILPEGEAPPLGHHQEMKSLLRSSNHTRIIMCVNGAGCWALLIRIKQQEDAFSVKTVEQEQWCSLEQTGGTRAVSKFVPFRKNCALEILCPPCYGRMHFFEVF